MSFYADLLKRLVADGTLDPAASTLVVAGDGYDRDELVEAGFSNVTISNLEVGVDAKDCEPYSCLYLDAEDMDLPDNSFDQVIEHMGLHHCRSPHRGLLEMFRVAKDSVLIFENRDSMTLRLAAKLGLSGHYELQSVRVHNLANGGIRNSPVPNHVYRWTEREVEKTLKSADPAYRTKIRYFHNTRMPGKLDRTARGVQRALLGVARVGYKVYSKLLPKQANVFAFLIEKSSREMQPWMNEEGTALNEEWAASRKTA